MKAQIYMVTPSHLFTNARNVDVFFKNAGAGLQRKSTEFGDGIIEHGGFSTTESFPRMPHNFGDQYPYSNFIAELTAHPIKRKPAVVNFETNTLRYNSAYWLTIDRLTKHGEMARIEASIDGAQAPPAGPRFGPGAPGQANGQGGGQPGGQGGRPGGQFRPQAGPQGAQRPAASKPALRISTVNIDALTLRLGESPMPKGAPVTVDGQEIAGPFSETVHLSREGGKWHSGEWTATGMAKRHGLQGPIGDAFNSYFLSVYGEADRDLAIAELDAIRNPPGPLDNLTDFPHETGGQSYAGGHRLLQSDSFRHCGNEPGTAAHCQIAAGIAHQAWFRLRISESRKSFALCSGVERQVAEWQRPTGSPRMDDASQPAARLSDGRE